MNKNFSAVVGVVAGLILALILATYIPTAHIEVIAIVLGVMFLVVCVSLQGKVWLLVPATLMMTGSLNFLPSKPWIWQLMALAAFGMLAVRCVLGVRELKLKFKFIDFVILVQILVLAQAYMRNPVGFSFLGSETIGAKSYYNYAYAVIAYLIFSSIKVDLKGYRYAIILMIVMGLMDAALATVAGLIPSIGWVLARFYNHRVLGFSDLGLQETALELDNSRFAFGSKLGKMGMLVCATIWRPVSSLSPLQPLRFLLFVVSLVASLLSGFRSLLVGAAMLMTFGSLARKKGVDVMLGALGAFIVLVVIIMSGMVEKLPWGAQRALSFIPGVTVSGGAAENAQKSADWRFEMWDLALKSDRYIHNKLLGDGFGLSAVEYQLAMDEKMGVLRPGGGHGGIDFMMAKGSYHSFHIETIRYTGVVGLVLAFFAMLYFAKLSLELIKYFRGREEFGYVLFITIPMIIYPISYLFIIGSYKSVTGFSMILAQAGLLRMLDNIRHEELVSEGEPEQEQGLV